jgi:hypothetical protein
MLVKRLVIAVVLAALLAPLAAYEVIAATPTSYTVTEVSEDYWLTDTTFTAVGEVRNDTDVPVRNVRIRVTLFGSEYSAVATAIGEPWFTILDPGETASFRVDLARPADVRTYRIEVDDWTDSSLAANHYFTATSSQARLDSTSTKVRGSVRNANVVPAGEVAAVATLYDADGNVIGSGAVEVPGLLAPGESAPFEVVVEHDRIDGTPTVGVVAESTSDPETAVTFGADPADLTYGKSTTISGTAPTGATVSFERYDQAMGRWVATPDSSVAAGPGGAYETTMKPSVGTTYRAVAGDVASVPVLVHLDVAVSLRASTKSTTVGKKVTLSGRARPTDPGSRVAIQRKVGPTWKTIASGRIAESNGTFSIAWTPKAKGTYVIRAFVEDQSLVFPGASSMVTIVVR